MIKLSLTGLTTAAGGLVLVVAAGAGVASASPDDGPMINTTCTYDQSSNGGGPRGESNGCSVPRRIAAESGIPAFVPGFLAGPTSKLDPPG